MSWQVVVFKQDLVFPGRVRPPHRIQSEAACSRPIWAQPYGLRGHRYHLPQNASARASFKAADSNRSCLTSSDVVSRAARLRDAFFTAQAFQHNTDFFFSVVFAPCCSADVPYCFLSAVIVVFCFVIINLHWVNDEIKVSLIQSEPSVHLVLTGYRVQKSFARSRPAPSGQCRTAPHRQALPGQMLSSPAGTPAVAQRPSNHRLGTSKSLMHLRILRHVSWPTTTF